MQRYKKSFEEICGGSVYHYKRPGNLNARYTHIAMFDLDHTIVESNRKIPRNADDWFVPDHVRTKLKQLNTAGYFIVIITNQYKADTKDEFRFKRILNIIESLEIQLEVFVSVWKDKYRKPETGIFERLIAPRTTDVQDIFYVGDMAGRAQDRGKDSDLKFVHNINLWLADGTKVKFYSNEEYFEAEPVLPKTMHGFDPEAFLKNPPEDTRELYNYLADRDETGIQTLVVLIGPPASGKTTVAQLTDYIRVSNDDSKAKTLRAFVAAVESGKSVVLDNTNPSKRTRRGYIDEAKHINKDIHVVFVLMQTLDNDMDLYTHVAAYRHRIGGPYIPPIAIKMFYRNYEPPVSYEYNKLFKMPFAPRFDPEQRMRFLQRA